MKIKKIIPLLFIFALPLFFSCKDEDPTMKVTGVILNKTSVLLVKGDSETLTAAVAPSDATNKKVVWKSSDETVATVDSNGKITAVKDGSAIVTVTTEDGNKTAVCTVTVILKKIPVTEVSLDKTSLMLRVGDIETLVATVTPSGATYKKVTWKSSDNAVAMVGSYGKVTAIKVGSATITVTTEDGDKTATCNVTVQTSVTGISLNKNSLILIEGDSETLIATVIPSDATNKKVTWKSSDEAIATIDSNGKITAVKAGSITITVTTEEGNKTTECAVIVRSKNSIIDSRDNNVYNYVTLGNQVWMVENLRYLPSVTGPATGSTTQPHYYVFDYNGTDVSEAKAMQNYQKFGVLYNWPAAMNGAEPTSNNPSGVRGVCPEGWHLPSDAEWTQLHNYLADNGYNYDGTTGGGTAKIAKSMASESGWVGSGTEGAVGNSDYPEYKNKSGFTGVAGGRRNKEGGFDAAGYVGFLRSTSQWNIDNAKLQMLYFDYNGARIEPADRSVGVSVRCVRNN